MLDIDFGGGFDLVNMNDVMKTLGMSRTTLFRRMYQSENRIPFVKIGGKVFFVKSELKEWILSNRSG